MDDVDGLNAGFAKALLEEYLENPAGVPDEWRKLFESGDSELVAAHPGITRLLEAVRGGNGARVVAPPPSAGPAAPAPAIPTSSDELMLGAVAAAMALVK